jgi:V8-like Glu-specific endopeptidase
MRRTYFIRTVVSAALVAALATPAQSSIFDRDDRQYVSTAEKSPYSPVGRVTQHNLIMRSFATGFLVDECHVLTSQIVLGYGQTPVGKRLTFETAVGTPQQESTKATVVAAGGFRRNRTSEEQYERGGRDWLLLRLDRCLGASLGYVTLKTGPFSPYEFRDLKSAGFPQQRSRRRGLTLDPSCRIIASRGTVWLNDCATVAGDAGDPIFRISGSGARPQMEVYAMQSAGFTRTNPVQLKPGYENQAVPMSLIASQIASYLSANGQRRAGESDTLTSQRADAVPHIGTSVGAASDRSLLDTSLGETDR